MEDLIIAVVAFGAGFVIGNITKLELPALTKKVVRWVKSRKK